MLTQHNFSFLLWLCMYVQELCYCCCCCCCSSWFILLPSPQANPPGLSSGGGAAPGSAGTPSKSWRLKTAYQHRLVRARGLGGSSGHCTLATHVQRQDLLTWDLVSLGSWILLVYWETHPLRSSRHDQQQCLKQIDKCNKDTLTSWSRLFPKTSVCLNLTPFWWRPGKWIHTSDSSPCNWMYRQDIQYLGQLSLTWFHLPHPPTLQHPTSQRST